MYKSEMYKSEIYENEIYESDINIESKDRESNTSFKMMIVPRIDNEPILLKTLYTYFTKAKFEIVLSVLDRKNNDVSLRLLDWLVTNYAKKNNTCYNIDEKNINFNIFISYKSQLKAYSKRQFDPFCRRSRIVFSIDELKLSTTIGQLNFFRWAINNNVIKYAKDNYKEIEDDMLIAIKKNPKYKNKKRSELSVCAVKSFTCKRYNSNITLD